MSRFFLDLWNDISIPGKNSEFRKIVRDQVSFFVRGPEKESDVPWVLIGGQISSQIGSNGEIAFSKTTDQWIGFRSDFLQLRGSNKWYLSLVHWLYHFGAPDKSLSASQDVADAICIEAFGQDFAATYNIKTKNAPTERNRRVADVAASLAPIISKWSLAKHKEITETAAEFIVEYAEHEPSSLPEGISEQADRKHLFESELEKATFEYQARYGPGSSKLHQTIAVQLEDQSTLPFEQNDGALNEVWVSDLIAEVENPQFIKQKIDDENSRSTPNATKIYFLHALLANVAGHPSTDLVLDPKMFLDSLILRNASERTQHLIRFVRAKYLLLNGHSHKSLQDFDSIKTNTDLPDQLQADAHYNLINGSYSLRDPEHYGGPNVSTELFGTELGGFDAQQEIADFCNKFEVRPESFSKKSIEESTAAYGSSAAKIIYFHFLERLLREGTDEKLRRNYFDAIVQSLKLLSSVPRSGTAEGYYNKECYYPFVFLYSVARHFHDFDMLDRIERILTGFDGWDRGSRLASLVREEIDQGNLIMMIHLLNQSRVLRERGQIDDAERLAAIVDRNFANATALPALADSINYETKSFGGETTYMREASARRRYAVSHRNYIIGY